MQPQQIYRECSESLEAFMHDDAGFSDAVIGLSGGIDSSVVCVLACDVLGAEHVHGVLMPGPYSSDQSISAAESLADVLEIDTRLVSICEPFEAFEQVLGVACGGQLSGTAAENTQARCRMVTLMALSNTYDWVVLNTGNKSEAMMGYSTLYGDTAGAFAPLGGIYKTDVYAIAKWRNAQAQVNGEAAPIPEDVLIKPPSAELSPNQSDEASLGITYDALDRILIAAFEHNLSVDEIAEQNGLDRSLVASVIERAESFAYKRAAEPPFPETKFY